MVLIFNEKHIRVFGFISTCIPNTNRYGSAIISSKLTTCISLERADC